MKENPIQHSILEVLKTSQCGKLNGKTVIKDMRARRDLWRAILPTFSSPGSALMGLSKGQLQVDGLYLLPMSALEEEKELIRLARKWKPSELLRKRSRAVSGNFVCVYWNRKEDAKT